MTSIKLKLGVPPGISLFLHSTMMAVPEPKSLLSLWLEFGFQILGILVLFVAISPIWGRGNSCYCTSSCCACLIVHRPRELPLATFSMLLWRQQPQCNTTWFLLQYQLLFPSLVSTVQPTVTTSVILTGMLLILPLVPPAPLSYWNVL